MLSRSYFILSPAGPTDIGAAEITQRQSIPLIWAFAIASPNATFRHEGGNHFFETTVGDALSMLDRGLAAWNYNSYFRDILAPVGIFRSWLANYPSETSIYVNVTELLRRSPNPDRDIAELKKTAEKGSDAERRLADMETKYKTDTDALNAAVAQIKLDAALDTAILGAKGRKSRLLRPRSLR